MKPFNNFILAFFLVLLAIAIGFLIFEWFKSRKRKALAAPHIKLLHDSKPDVRAQAAQALGEIGHASAVPPLIEALADTDMLVRASASGALGKIGEGDSLGSLVQIAIHDDIPSVRIAAVEALQAVGKRYVRFIDKTRLLESINASQHARELQDLIDTYILPGLMLALKDDDAKVQEAGIAALQRLGEAKILETSVKQRDPKTDDVQFSAFYPPTVTPEVRDHLFVYAHLQGRKVEVENDLRSLVNWVGENAFKSKATKQSTRLRLGTRLTIVPESDELQFSPASLTRPWKGDYVRFKFRFKPVREIQAEAVDVRVSIQVEGMEIARVKLSMKLQRERSQPVILGRKIENPLAEAKHNCQTAGIYQKIFVSYSRKDREVVELYRLSQLALGNDVFIDTYSIHTGEDWRAALARAIDTADVFQLFWSKHSAASPNVRDEWDYALKYKCPKTRCADFIRPVYWVDPMPAFPPQELGHLNFKYIPLKERFRQKEKKS